ncbi:hypothetical protein SNE40_019222 [Patella caerulea]|uniref:Fibronectin type III-like domain-containing protein n=1 Tax=Patella caerulea TaxID=87958 RepID=A0AAN8JA83_PATCE
MYVFGGALHLFLLVQFSVQDYPFRNVSLSWDVRVEDLVGRLTLDEMTLQMAKGGAGQNGPAPAIPRLGIGPYQWDTECLHGSVKHNATSYPQSIGLAATWSYDTIRTTAKAIAEDVRAIHNEAVKTGNYSSLTGLGCFSPVINIMRDPRWGRNQETYGEDPFLNGMLAKAYVKGLQGDHPRYVRANAGCKHFNVHGGPDNIPSSRWSFDSKVSMRDWRTTFLPAFRHCVEAGTYSLMCSYNSINGVPACANKELLTDILRTEWGFKGYVVSDEAAIEGISGGHNYTNNSVACAAAAISAGCNLELADPRNDKETFMSIPDAVHQGFITEDLVRDRVKPLFYTRMRLGEFDPPELNPYTFINTSVINDQAHRDLALEVAMKSFVLLKNNGVLPLKKPIYNNIAVVGPTADAAYLISGDYAALPDPRFVTTPRQALQSLASHVNYVKGCNDTRCYGYDSNSIKMAVKGVDVAFIFIGLGILIEAEGNDRADIQLPGYQQQLIEDVVNNCGEAEVILVSLNAGPVNITWADQNPKVSAILAVFYPGQAIGVAIKNVLTSSNQPQFGRLPYTWYHTENQVPDMVNYTMVNRTYRYFTGEPLYPFGYGLTYTSFGYRDLILNDTVNAGEELLGSVTVDNTGNTKGDEVIQIYLVFRSPSVTSPKIQLVNFTRVTIPKGGTTNVDFSISPQNMAVYTEDKGWVVEPDIITVYVGGQQPGQKKTAATQVLSKTVQISNYKILGFY